MSSPNYRTRQVPDIKARMQQWTALTRAERNQMWTRLLVELPADPYRHLYESVKPPNVWAYRFQIGDRPHRRFFYFAIERRDYVGELWIVEATLTLEEGDAPSGNSP